MYVFYSSAFAVADDAIEEGGSPHRKLYLSNPMLKIRTGAKNEQQLQLYCCAG
jgi:hypothetical protein